jgi:magnesium transporter
MKVNCFRISEGPKLSVCEYDFATEAINQKTSRVWIDILDADTSELEVKLDELKVRGLIRQLSIDSRDHPGFYPFRPLALLVIPVQMEEQTSNIMEYLSILYCEDFLVSVRSSKMARFRKSISAEDSFDLLPDDTIAGVISALMMGLSLDCLRKAARLSDMILTLETHMERDPDSVDIEEISGKRSELLTLESIVQGQLPIIETIISSDRPTKNPESTLEYLRWAAANLKSADRKLEWLERRIDVMRTLIDMHAQERTNRRLGRLTILSMIFMPVTFLAGIWGMNFKSMPLLSVNYGYIYALIIMFIISGGMYFYFYRKGWFS